jgi:VCBS repeat-containing protein
VTLNADGSYSFDPSNAAYQDLGVGESRDVVVGYTASDGNGGIDTGTLTITVTGTNDAPVVTDETATVAEDAAVITGTVAANDTDVDGDTLTYTANGALPAGVTLNADGSYSFDPSNAAYQDLGVGESRDVVVGYTASDGNGGTDTGTLTITVTGTNDAPVAVDDTAAGNEDTLITGSVAANDSDVDGDTLTYTANGMLPAGFTLNPDGTFTLDASDPAYQNLRQDEILDVVIDYTVDDGNGGTDTGTLTITVTGQVEQRSLDVDDDSNLGTRYLAYDAGPTDFAFTDDDDVANTVVVDNFGADDYIIFDAPFDGSAGGASFANIDFDGDGLANDLAISVNKNGVVSDIILRDAVDPNAVIFTEAQAEAAIGAGFENFRTTTESTVVSASLDVDNDSNIGTRFTIPQLANTATFNFTDDDDVANTVLVRGFGGDDTITFDAPFDGSAGGVTFANIDFDGDGLANDLAISSNKNGVVSDIILLDAVDPNLVISSEAQAEAAIGGGTENFISGAVPPPPPPPPPAQTAASLDQDNDGNLGTYFTIDAGNDGFAFSDDAQTANSVRIINFTSDDRIVFESGSAPTFANIDADGDGLANDLQIDTIDNGIVSTIILVDAVDPSAIIFSEAMAENALGFDAFNFA